MSAKAQSHPAVTAAEFRAACGLFASGVTVVTRRMADDSPYGMTVSSFTSVSLDPPLVLVCIDRSARFLRDLLPDQPFAVNVLSAGQQHLAIRFANRQEEDRFSGIEWNPGWHGVPLLSGTITTFACSLGQLIESGDHFILVGRVRDIRRYLGSPLIWCDRGYHALPVPAEPSA